LCEARWIGKETTICQEDNLTLSYASWRMFFDLCKP
jgi:hypothetical protein